MKKANYIISHLKTKPYLKNLQHIDCYNQLLALLPKNISNNTKFLYQKNDILFFVLNHPGIKMEFNYKSNLIKSILKKLIDVHPECNFMKSKEIKAFISNKTTENRADSFKKRPLRYNEQSNGDFINMAKNREISKIIEEIRKTISRQK